MEIKNIKRLIGAGFIVGLIWITIDGCITFMQGMHNIDIAYNFLNLGYLEDLNTDGIVRSLEASYIKGINQVQIGFAKISLSSILGFIGGWLLSKKE